MGLMITSAIESGLLQGYGTSTAESDATPATDAPKAHAYRPDVDGLRAVAVLGVVVYHMSPSALPGGFFGVDIFFVISGYVVTGSLLSNTETTMSAYIAGFYARRVKRLTPALVLMVAVMAFLLRLLVESPPGHTAAWLPEDMKVAPPFDGYFLSGQLSLVGLANLYYATLKVSYFSQGTRSLEYNPFTHCWSLGVEEQFYLCFPLLVMLTYRRRVAANAPDCRTKSFASGWLAAAVLAALIPLSYTLAAVWDAAGGEQQVFYQMPARFWQLASGALLCDLHDRHGRARVVDKADANAPAAEAAAPAAPAAPPPTYGRFGSIRFATPGFGPWIVSGWLAREAPSALAAAMIVVALAIDTAEQTQLLWALLPVCGALGFIYCGRPHGTADGRPPPLCNRIVGHPAVAYVGRLSYSLYLWHWPTIVLAKWVDGLAPGHVFARFVVAFAFMAAAAISYHLVETPARRKPARTWHALLLMAGLIGVVEIELWLLQRYGDGLCINKAPVDETPACPNTTGISRHGLSHAAIRRGYVIFGRMPSSRCACRYCGVVTRHRPANVTDEPSAPLCWAPLIHSPQELMSCTFLPGDGRQLSDIGTCLSPDRTGAYPKPTFFLIGDSHAQAHAPGIAGAIRGAMQLRTASFVAGCGIRSPAVLESWGQTGCLQYLEPTLAAIASNLKAGDVVGIINAMYTNFGPLARQNARWYETVVRPMVASKGASLLLLGDNLPLAGVLKTSFGPLEPMQTALVSAPSGCLDTPLSPNREEPCTVPMEPQEQPASEDEAFAALASRHTNDTFHFSAWRLLCDDLTNECNAVIPGTATLAYEDDHHLNTEGAAYLWPYLCDFMEEKGLLP